MQRGSRQKAVVAVVHTLRNVVDAANAGKTVLP